MMDLPLAIENVSTLCGNFNCCTAPGKSLGIVLPSLGLRSAPRGSTDVFQGCGSKVPILHICLYLAAVLILNLIAPKQLMPVSSM